MAAAASYLLISALLLASTATSFADDAVIGELGQATSSAQASTVKAKGTLTVKGLRVASGAADGSMVHFGPDSAFAAGTDSAGQFVIQHAGASMLSLDPKNVLHIASPTVLAQGLDVAGELTLGGVKQWRLAHYEDFSNPAGAVGWSRKDVSSCGGINMLGGYCKFGQGEVTKSFGPFPAHTQLRIKGTYHFIDRWIGESAFLKLNVGRDGGPTVVWTDRHSEDGQTKGMNVCGQADTPEGKFAQPFEVTVPHSMAMLEATFGSTMDSQDACDQSWGVSGLEIYVM